MPHDRIRMDRYDGGDVHDSERPLAALQNTLNVDPPKIQSHNSRKRRRSRPSGQVNINPGVMKQVVQETHKTLARRNAAYRSRKNVVEQKGRDRDLSQGTAPMASFTTR